MALNDEIRREQRKLKGQPLKVKLAYFWDYYKIHTIVTLSVLAAIVLTVREQMLAKDTALGVYFINAAAAEETVASAYAREFEQLYGIDTAEYEVYFSTSQYLTPGTERDNYDFATVQKIVAEQAAAEMDVTVMDAWNFISYNQSGMFGDLRDFFDAETLEKIGEDYGIYYVDMAEIEAENLRREDAEYLMSLPRVSADEATASELLEGFVLPDPETMAEPVPVGVLMNGAPMIREGHFYDGIAALGGIAVNSQRVDIARDFFLWTLYGDEAGIETPAPAAQ